MGCLEFTGLQTHIPILLDRGSNTQDGNVTFRGPKYEGGPG